MEIRLAHPNEVTAIMGLIEDARAFLADSGSNQWQGENGYPDATDIIEDIMQAQAWVGLLDGQVVAYAAVIDGHDEAYDAIYDGKWQHDNYRYIAFHRIAVAASHRGQQVTQTFLQGLIEWHKGPDFRCDTHEKNVIMQHILEKLGFVYCGKVPIDGERLAYQKIKSKRETHLYQEVAEDDRWMLTEPDYNPLFGSQDK